ncbi:MAG: helix-turn-helix transcriptional regulator [Kiloniellaceae bacterium]
MDEDTADLAALVAARASGEEAFPLQLIERLHEGDHPVKVYREHRGLTQAELASRVGLSKIYISQIETGRRTGATKTLTRIARALGVGLDDLAAWPQG